MHFLLPLLQPKIFTIRSLSLSKCPTQPKPQSTRKPEWFDKLTIRSLSLSKRPTLPNPGKPGWFGKLTTRSLSPLVAEPVEAPNPTEPPTQMVRQAHHPFPEPSRSPTVAPVGR